MPPLKKTNWQDYLRFASGKTLDDSRLDLVELEDILSINQRMFGAFFYHSVPVVYLLDYTTGHYLSMSKMTKNMLGENADTFIVNGIEYVTDIYQRDDLELFNDQIFPDRLELLRQIPVEDQHNYVFSYSYRLRNRWGGYTNLLQRNCFVKSDEQGNPLMSMGIILNVDGFIPSAPVIQTVARISEDPGTGGHETVFKKHYALRSSERLLSRREAEVLKWIAEGLTSEEIAEKMFLSEHTVVTHRRNMQEKTGTPSAAALVAFGFREGYL